MKTPSLDHYLMMPGQRILLETALTNQEKIGWNYALRGYLSTSWVDSEHIVNKQPHDGLRQTWLRTIIKNIWKFGKTMWTHRNSVLHSKTTPQKDLTESGVNAQIRSLYEQQHDFAALDQVIFDTPLEVMLTRPIRSKKHWVCLAQRYHPLTYDRKTGKQNLITSFFPRLASRHKATKPTRHQTRRKQPKRTRPKKKQPFTRSSNRQLRRQFHVAPD